jgi:hypothetical protein
MWSSWSQPPKYLGLQLSAMGTWRYHLSWVEDENKSEARKLCWEKYQSFVKKLCSPKDFCIYTKIWKTCSPPQHTLNSWSSITESSRSIPGSLHRKQTESCHMASFRSTALIFNVLSVHLSHIFLLMCAFRAIQVYEKKNCHLIMKENPTLL